MEVNIVGKIHLIPAEGQFFKANLHSHSTASDGKMTPQEAKDYYKQRGYSIYAYTDHNVLHYYKELSDPTFLVLCGYEIHIMNDPSEPFEKTRHINAIARDPERAVYISREPYNYSAESFNSLIAKLCENNYIVIYNHPGWSSECRCQVTFYNFRSIIFYT